MTHGLHTLNLAWLTRLRWAAVAGQLTTMGVAALALDVALPWGALLLIVAAEVASNAVGHAWLAARRPIGEGLVAGVMVFDLLALTALLYATGGPTNPFNFLYLVHVALAAIVLRPSWAWGLAALSAALFALLFVAHEPLVFVGDHGGAGGHGHSHHGGSDAAMDVHTRGMWVAFTVAAVFIVYFTHRIHRELAARDAELATARARAERTERLAALATLAAGAAHELSTPLSTIAVVARELERDLVGPDHAPEEAVEDARLIRSEVARCRAVLDRLAGDAARPRGEAAARVSVAALAAGLADGRPEGAVTVEVAGGVGAHEVVAQVSALTRALRGLVDNAIAAGGEAPVVVRAGREGDDVIIEVVDRGVGIPADALARVGEPFFSTREPGAGMGLGVFVARAVVADHGGEVELESAVGTGTRARVALPLVPRDEEGAP